MGVHYTSPGPLSCGNSTPHGGMLRVLRASHLTGHLLLQQPAPHTPSWQSDQTTIKAYAEPAAAAAHGLIEASLKGVQRAAFHATAGRNRKEAWGSTRTQRVQPNHQQRRL